MTTKRATLLTINTLTSLHKVCSSHNSSLDSIKALTFIKTLSTATEKSQDFQSSNGQYHVDNSSQYHQNPTGFYSDNNQSTVNFGQNPNGYSPDGSYRENPGGFYGGDSVQVQGSLNPYVGHRENSRIQFQHNPVGQNGNFDGYNGQNPNGVYAESLKGFEQSSRGVYGENKNIQNPNGFYQQSVAGSGSQGSVVGNYGGNVGQFSQSMSGNYAGNVGMCQQSAGGYQMGNVGENWQSLNVNYSENAGQHQESMYGNSNNNFEQIQQSPSNYYTGSTGMNQYRENVGGHWQNSNAYYSGNVGEYQQSLNGNLSNCIGQNQQSKGEHYIGNTATYQHRENVGEYQQSLHGYYSENVGEYQQSPNGNFSSNNVVQYQQTQNGMEGSQISSNSKADGDCAEATESNEYRGTLEDLDGFCKEVKVKEAIEVLGSLEKQGIPVDLHRYVSLMRACGEAKALQEAKVVHEHIVRSVSPINVGTYNKILEMYSKCGSMDDAFKVFNKMPERNLTSWDTMITWLASNGLGEDAIDMFTRFKKAGLKPDGQMFIGVFSACKDLGDIDEGMLHFESMSEEYGIIPSMKHYVIVVDMLGSTGHLDEALEFIEKMPLEPSVDIWETLMNLCRIHGNLELGDRCAELVEQLDPSRLTEQSKAGLIPIKPSDIAKEQEKKKLAGQNLLEVKSRVHEYRAGDTSHPLNDKIYAQLRGLRAQMKEAGYVPETRFVLHDIDQESKEDALLAHSERLAVSHGFLTSPVRSSIRVIKNLRVCGDCHNALKIISKLVGRELIMRDAKRFHHFKDGVCSCRDYW